jgi:hypothetical protein
MGQKKSKERKKIEHISRIKKKHFNVNLMMRSRVYYREEGGDFFPNLGYMNIVSSKQIKVVFIFINHIHCLACVCDLFVRCMCIYHFILIRILEFPHTHISPMCEVKECTPSFSYYLFSITSLWGFISQALGRI